MSAKSSLVWQKNNPDRVAAKDKRWAERHPDRVIARNARNYRKHRDKILQRKKERYWENKPEERKKEWETIKGMSEEEKKENHRIRSREWHGENREKHSVAMSKLYQKHKGKYKMTVFINRLKRVYGITLKDYNQLLESSEGKCAICGRLFEERTPHIDHDHKTGSVRGLLCVSCNQGLGMFGDNRENLKNAIEYLNKYGGEYHACGVA